MVALTCAARSAGKLMPLDYDHQDLKHFTPRKTLTYYELPENLMAVLSPTQISALEA